MSKEEEEYELEESVKKIGRLYPILKSADGEILDGLHRRKADPEWEEKVLSLSDPISKLIVKIIANTQRRTISKKERKEQLNELAELLLKKGVKPGEITKEISKLGFSLRYVQKLLDSKYKGDTGEPRTPPRRRRHVSSARWYVEKYFHCPCGRSYKIEARPPNQGGITVTEEEMNATKDVEEAYVA